MMTLSSIFGKDLHRTVLASGLSLVLFAAFGASAVAGELPKQGTIKHSWTFSGPYEGLEVGEQWAGIARFKLITVPAEGGDLPPMVADCVGMGIDTHWEGYCVFTDADGDKIFDQWEDVDEKGTGTFMGGTGKYAGIKGSREYEFYYLPDMPEGNFTGIGDETGSYTLP